VPPHNLLLGLTGSATQQQQQQQQGEQGSGGLSMLGDLSSLMGTFPKLSFFIENSLIFFIFFSKSNLLKIQFSKLNNHSSEV
jgi:hypothetical protein